MAPPQFPQRPFVNWGRFPLPTGPQLPPFPQLSLPPLDVTAPPVVQPQLPPAGTYHPNALEQYESVAQQMGQAAANAPRNVFLPNSGFFGRHPGLSSSIEGALGAAANMQPAATIGGNIANGANALLQMPAAMQQLRVQRAVAPYTAQLGALKPALDAYALRQQEELKRQQALLAAQNAQSLQQSREAQAREAARANDIRQQGLNRPIGIPQGGLWDPASKTTISGPGRPPQINAPVAVIVTPTSGKPYETMAAYNETSGWIDTNTQQPIKGTVLRKPSQSQAGGQLSPTSESNIINRLQTQWDRLNGPVRELRRQAQNMAQGIEAAKRGDMAAGSQAVLVTFQKILDPTSVVRESEYARSAAGQALLSRIQGAYEQLAKGGAGVPVSELQKFADLGAEWVRNAANSPDLKVARSRASATAKRYNIPEELIFGNEDALGADRSGIGPATAQFKYTATGPKGEKIGSNDGETWQPIP